MTLNYIDYVQTRKVIRKTINGLVEMLTVT